MKYFLVFLLYFSCTSAFARENQEKKQFKLPPIKLNHDILPENFKLQNLKSLLNGKTLMSGFMVADVTNFTNEVLEKIKNVIVESGFDPMELEDEVLTLFPVGSLGITNGWLEELSSIATYDEVILKYTRDTNILELTLPLGFKTLMITYKYQAQFLLLFISGNIDAKISDVKLHLHMGFNFDTLQAFVDKVDVKDTGSITFDFTGLGLLDWIIEAMSNVLTTLFHGLILGVIDALIQDPVNAVVNDINKLIDSIFHPNETNFAMYY